MNDEQAVIPESDKPENTPATSSAADDDLRYAPPEVLPVSEEASEVALSDAPEIDIDEAGLTVTDGLDIEAALAAVSSLSDLVAEQEATEQARIVQEEAQAQLQAERQARLDHPERFFPVPPLTTLYRGQMASFVPAILLILIGSWLTFTLTTSKVMPDAGLLATIAAGGLALTLFARWIASGRWARGSLFFALLLLFCGITGGYLIQSASPGFAQGWPLLVIALGLSFLVTAFLSRPLDRRFILPGILLIISGVAGLIVTLSLLSSDFLTTAGSLWPIAVIVIFILWLLPVIFRQRQ